MTTYLQTYRVLTHCKRNSNFSERLNGTLAYKTRRVFPETLSQPSSWTSSWIHLLQQWTTTDKYCKSINVCLPLNVRISRLVENRKLTWPQTFSGTFTRLVQTTCRQRSIHQPRIDVLLESSQQNMTTRGIKWTQTAQKLSQKIEAAVSADI